MVNVEQITIDLTLPTNEVSVVAMQPYLELQPDEPFKLRENLVDDQLNAVRKTLALAQNSFNDRSAHFTIFPEYSVPGLEGIEIIDQEISSANWSNGSVILAGIHGLTKTEFHEICGRLNATLSNENNPIIVPDEKWINSCFMWVKENNGVVRRFIQLKIRPSWPESTVSCNDMFCGSTIYVFNCRFSHNVIVPCRFTTFICFDWVAANNGSTVRDEMLRNLQNQLGNEISLHWIFVIQHNNSPNHTTFLNSTVQYITDPENNYPLVRRNEAVVLHFNTAANDKPLKLSNTIRGAFTACVIAPTNKLDCNDCRPSVCMQPNYFRGSNILKDAQCKDIVFREIGECIHHFKLRVPRFLVSGAANRTLPISDAEVHSVKDIDDPRLSGKSIPASLKWFNDSLDEINSLAQTSLSSCPLFHAAEAQHKSVTSKMRLTEGKKIEKQINWAACFKEGGVEIRTKEQRKNPDLWDFHKQIETNAFKHFIHTLTNLAIVYDLEIVKANFHGALVFDDKFIQVIAIKGENYSDCRFHYDNNVTKEGIDPVLVVFSDRNNHTPTKEEYSKYYETDIDSGEKFIDYNTIVTYSRDVDNVQNLKVQLDGHLPSDRKII